MKIKGLIVLYMLVLLVFVGCDEEAMPQRTERIKPVKVLRVYEREIPIDLSYSGVIKENTLYKLSFKAGGRIEELLVSEGQQVTEGMELAKLDNTDLNFAYELAKAKMEGADASYNKALNGARNQDVDRAILTMNQAKELYDLSASTFDDMQKLFEVGAVSKSEYDQARLQRDVNNMKYQQAEKAVEQMSEGARTEDILMLKSQVAMAKKDLEYKEALLDEAVLKSHVNGYVVKVLNQQGELINQGYPVVVVRDDDVVASVGLSQADINQLKIGDQAKIKINGKEEEGEIIRINPVIDRESGTYEAEILLPNSAFVLGQIGEVVLPINTEKGYWIPIQVIRSTDKDFVYVAEEDKAKRRPINVLLTKGSYAKVTGLEEDDKVIVEGLKNLHQNEAIEIVDGGD